jgi:hypothetical protein
LTVLHVPHSLAARVWTCCHARPFEPQSKVIFRRFRQLLAINAHKMAPSTGQWLQVRVWDTPTKGLLWYWHLLSRVLPPSPSSQCGTYDTATTDQMQHIYTDRANAVHVTQSRPEYRANAAHSKKSRPSSERGTHDTVTTRLLSERGRYNTAIANAAHITQS